MSLSGRRLPGGAVLAVLTTAALTAAMVPLRSELGTTTSALVLVVPVVLGTALGGRVAGACSVAAAFIAYDLFFVPPYGTLVVGSWRVWLAAAVYAVVMVLVARVVADLGVASAEARRNDERVRRLFELSELLVGELGETDLLQRVVSTVHDAFGMTSVVMLLDRGGQLEPVAAAGAQWSPTALAALVPRAGVPIRLDIAARGLRSLVLAATGAPMGLLGLDGPALGEEDGELLRAFANHAALSLERARLREQAVRSEILEETERLQKALMGAVSHDLRTPLATIKVSASTLRQAEAALEPAERKELLESIDTEADRLERLVRNLLDMTRVQAGALRVMPQPLSLADVVTDTLGPLDAVLAGHPLTVDVPGELPPVLADHVLVGQVLANLLENAARHSPPGTPVEITACPLHDEVVMVSVADHGPGLGTSPEQMFEPFRGGGPGHGTGVGLSIAKAFVEAHGQRIWAEEVEGGGTRFCFSLPTAADPAGGS